MFIIPNMDFNIFRAITCAKQRRDVWRDKKRLNCLNMLELSDELLIRKVAAIEEAEQKSERKIGDKRDKYWFGINFLEADRLMLLANFLPDYLAEHDEHDPLNELIVDIMIDTEKTVEEKEYFRPKNKDDLSREIRPIFYRNRNFN